MSTPSRLALFVAVIALLGLGGYAVGTALGAPAPAPAAGPGTGGPGAGGHGDGGHGGAGQGHAEQGDEHGPDLPAGLASSRDGYTLVPADTVLPLGTPTPFRFRVTGSDGAAVTAFDEEHTQRMHLILVRRDGTGFQHLHPRMAPDGTWEVPLTVPAAGAYRAFADFTPTGADPLTLGVDLGVAGEQSPVRHPPSRTAQLDDYQVRLAGDLVAGQAAPLTLTVTRGGAPVTDLQPYLGAYGHLVALREGDLAYLHVHPDGAPGDGRTAAGPQVRFVAEVPSAGSYRLFLDFQHAGVVRTAEFTVAADLEGARR